MKKTVLFCLLLALLLCGCGKETVPPRETPFPLTVSCGEADTQAMPGTLTWNWKDAEKNQQTTKSSLENPFALLSSMPYLNMNSNTPLTLSFETAPDDLIVRVYTSANDYAKSAKVAVEDMTIDPPTDRASYLYEVQAQWQESKKVQHWGVCTYYFLLLPEGTTNSAGDLPVNRLLQMTPADLFGVEIQNLSQNAMKLCRTVADKQAILECVQSGLVADFAAANIPNITASYVMRLAGTDGSQLTLSYAEAGNDAWLILGGTAYESQPLNLDSVWNGLKAATEVLTAENGEQSRYLRVSSDFPGDSWGEDYIYGYLYQAGKELAYEEVLWVDDQDSPSGYRLEKKVGEQTVPVAANCEYWILEEHWQPYCQIPQSELQSYLESTEWSMLFRIYQKDGQAIAICEQYLP